jgi:glutamine synthetase
VPGLSYSSPTIDLRIIPENNRFKACPWNPKAGLVMARLEYLDGAPFELCGWSYLMRVCNDLRAKFGYEVRVGIEIEFSLLKRTPFPN